MQREERAQDQASNNCDIQRTRWRKSWQRRLKRVQPEKSRDKQRSTVSWKAIEERVSSGKETSNLIPGLRLFIEFLL